MTNSRHLLSRKVLALLIIIITATSFSACSIGDTLTKFASSLSPQNRFLDRLVREQTLAEQPDVQITDALSPVSYDSKYGYRSLDSEYKEIYDRIHIAVLNYHRYVDLRDQPIPINDFLRIFYYYIDDHPEAFWVNPHIENFYYDKSEEMSIGVILQYMTSDATDRFNSVTGEMDNKVADSEITSMREAFNTKVNQILETISPNDDDLMRELKIFNYIANNVKYDDDLAAEIKQGITIDRPVRQNAYGAAIESTTVCSGFSKLFLLLTNTLGLECLTQYGKLEGEGHQWNIISINGDYYNIDVTEPILTTPDKTYVNYTLFNSPDSVITKTHSIKPAYLIDSDFQVSYNTPACTATTDSFESFFAIKASGAFNHRDFQQKIERLYTYNISELYFKFPNDPTQSTVQNYFDNNAHQFESLVSRYFTMDNSYYFLEQTGSAFIKLNRK
ncbi:MAG: hypothetical protein LBB49_02240 [Gracilibacteraceae bacterium]|jgi:hypothetical protein|nr:hypothetical protein [Gracilibacteraceae bacterium]